MLCVCRFCTAFDNDYQEALRMIYSKQDLTWLRGILARELQVEENAGHVHKSEYTCEYTKQS